MSSQDTLDELDLALQPEGLAEVRALNEVVGRTGEKIEGNVCYWDQTSPEQYRALPPIADPDHVVKRVNLATLARRHTVMLEVGLNAGHSALICLLANPALQFYAVDICAHAYTQHAAAHLRQRFGRRFTFWPGDSREVLPRLALERPNLKFDLLHIDGGHSPELAMADISNGLRLAAAGAELVLDDVNAPVIGDVLEQVTALGYLAPLDNGEGLYETVLHEIMRVC